MCHDNEGWHKNWRGTGLSFINWHEEFDEILTWALESLKNLHFKWLLWPKHIMLELKKCRGVIFHDIKEWCKIWRNSDL